LEAVVMPNRMGKLLVKLLLAQNARKSEAQAVDIAIWTHISYLPFSDHSVSPWRIIKTLGVVMTVIDI
jgi:hypothetical protein